MDFFPIKPNVMNAIVWLAIALICMGVNKGIGTDAGAFYFMGGILAGLPAYFANILWIEGFDPHH